MTDIDGMADIENAINDPDATGDSSAMLAAFDEASLLADAAGVLTSHHLDQPDWFALHINSLLDIQVKPAFCCVRFARPLDVLSSAILQGGKSRATGWLNLRVGNNASTARPLPSPEETLKKACEILGMSLPVVGMMTAASMKSCRVRYIKRDHVFVCCVATTGIANARRAGDPADAEGWQACQRTAGVLPAGTINIAVFTNANLSDTAKVEALQIIAEAKAAACHDGNVISPLSQLAATGTGTDSTAVFSDPEGVPIDYCGKHVVMGEIIGSLVYDVVQEGIEACQSVSA